MIRWTEKFKFCEYLLKREFKLLPEVKLIFRPRDWGPYLHSNTKLLLNIRPSLPLLSIGVVVVATELPTQRKVNPYGLISSAAGGEIGM